MAGCALCMVSGDIRSNFGIIVQALADRTGVSYADVSFAVAVGQLMYGVTQPVFGIVAMKKSNGFVLAMGTLMMAAGLLLTTLARSAVVLVVTVGLLFFTGTGAVCFGIIMGAISPVLGERRASAASGILNASSGIGGSLLSPLMQALQASLGIGKLLVILSVPVLVLLPICLWVTRVSAAPVEGKREQIDVLGRLKQALADPDYRRLMIGFGTCGFHMCIIQTHIFSQIVSYGIAERTASLAYTVFGLTTMAGSVLCGFLFGITFGGHQIGGFISSWLGGVFIAQSGNYQAIWMFDIALCAIASAASYGIHRDVKRLSRAPER